ncbi:MAG: hypothetical protein J7M32_06050 [Deltaproteobacteria bacterium]|nr:hypothetical protein [Deltaproteobacteria bacterium]
MGFNIFSPVKKIKKKDKDIYDSLIEIIERFAPREHLSEREAYYYNYRIMDAYKQPLLDLLEIASQIDRYRRDPEGHSRRLFIGLKAFYDVKGRLSLRDAARDVALVRRFRDLLIYFYGKTDLSGQDIRGILKDIQPL